MLQSAQQSQLSAATHTMAKGKFSPIIGREITLTRDQLEGMMLGVAVGDALGLPVETWNAEQIRSKFGVLREFVPITHNPYFRNREAPLGTWSDDAQLTAAMFHAFADAKDYSLEAVIQRKIEAFKVSRAGWGKSTVAGTEALIDGLRPPDQAFFARLHSGTGNGIPMKIAAVAAYLAVSGGDASKMVKMVQEIAALTHPTSLSVSAGLAHVAGLLYCMACGPNDFSVKDFLKYVTNASLLGRAVFSETLNGDDLTKRLQRVEEVSTQGTQAIIEAFGGGCYVYESLPFSYAFFIRNPLSFDATIDAVNAGGDTDSNGALVAGLQGALLGDAIFPKSLIHQLHHPEPLRAAIARFAQSFGV